MLFSISKRNACVHPWQHLMWECREIFTLLRKRGWSTTNWQPPILFLSTQKQGLRRDSLYADFAGDCLHNILRARPDATSITNTTSRKYTTVLLGRMNGAWDVKQLEHIANSVSMPPLSNTPLDPFAVWIHEQFLSLGTVLTNCIHQGPNCQDWIRDFNQALVNQGVIEASAISIMETVPTVWRMRRPRDYTPRSRLGVCLV